MSLPPGVQSSGLLQLQDQRNILLGNGIIYYGPTYVNLGQIKGDASFNYNLRPYDVVGGNPIILLRRFTLEERCNVTVPLLEIAPQNAALYFRNFAGGAASVVGTPSGGGTLYSQQFGGNAHMPFSNMKFEHPTPEGGYIQILGWVVYPPLDLRLPFPEQRESIIDAVFEFKHDITKNPGQQLGQFDVFVVPIS